MASAEVYRPNTTWLVKLRVSFAAKDSNLLRQNMAKIQISETQFAFAFFHKYLLIPKQQEITFIFPTLRQEGNPKLDLAGADLVVDGNLFFQFKMPEFLTTRGAIEIINKQLDRDFIPFYRFQIKNSHPSCQFNLLQKAARVPGNIVRYISPMFHAHKNDSDEQAFASFFRLPPLKAMNLICSIDFAQFLNPHRKQPEDDTHKICYSSASVAAGEGYIFSEPERMQAVKSLDEFNGQSLNFIDRPGEAVTINAAIQAVIELFELDIIDDINRSEDSIEALQSRLIIQHNIFWLPILRSTKKRRIRILNELRSEDEQ